jgi:erythromycin esterase-like protein
MRWTEVPAAAWRTPQELVEEGFRRRRVVMLNEAHHGLTRCVRTRQLGRQLLPSAHAMGVRHLAMEALQPGDAEAANTTRRPPEAAGGYLAQPDMAELLQAALALGWTLWRYEADIDHAPAALIEQGLMSQAFTNWRELEQARNLAAVLASLAPSDRLLVWCGNSHASKLAHDDWTSMGYEFAALVAEGPS